MPVWQALYEELKPYNFIIIAVAFDTGGAAAVRKWIRPAEPIAVPPPFRDIMGWSEAQYAAAAAPAYPCLIDERHVVSQAYGIRNVPMSVWIDEEGRIVRPAEATGATDGFRSLDRSTLTMPVDVVLAGQAARKRYVDALRDWVVHGRASRYALSSDAVRARMTGPTHAEVWAAAHFRLGHYLYELGDADGAQRCFAEASRLCPESWHLVRQALELQGTGKASGPDFVAAVAALGDRPYYEPVVLD